MLKTGYSPPLESIVFTDKIARKGRLAIFHGIIGVLMPLLSAYGVFLGHDLKGDIQSFQAQMNSKCLTKVDQ